MHTVFVSVHTCGLCVWMGEGVHAYSVSVHTCGVCVWMGEGVNAYGVCECSYMWFMCVDGWMCACMNRCGHMCVYAY